MIVLCLVVRLCACCYISVRRALERLHCVYRVWCVYFVSQAQMLHMREGIIQFVREGKWRVGSLGRAVVGGHGSVSICPGTPLIYDHQVATSLV